ncbi:MAG: type VI secretion system tip protein TssI/VgrG [Myxococcota bacterium]
MAEVEAFIVPALDVEGRSFEVLHYRVEERLSEVPRLSCELIEGDLAPCPPAELVGRRATLHLRRTDGADARTFGGRVIRAARAPDVDGVRTIHLDIAPLPWSWSQRSDCRVFQGKNAQGVVQDVVDAAGLEGDVRWQLVEDHPAWPYLVQYRETDLAFAQRILAEEGIYFAVEHTDEGETLVLGDDPTGLADAPVAVLPYRAGHGFEEAADVVTGVGLCHEVTPDTVTFRDYDPARPQLDVTASASADGEGLEVYDYPARCTEPHEAQRKAQIALEQRRSTGERIEGDTGSLGLRPGLRFAVEAHPYEPINRAYAVVAVRLEGRAPRLGSQAPEAFTYRCRFEAIPTDRRALRPPPRPRQAHAIGLSTAVVTGPAGEEIHVDDTAAVTVRYPWDRLGPTDDGSSVPMRTQQLALGDSMLLPRVGWEVSVAHLEGDPDRALVMGRFFNATHPPPYDLPAEAATSSLQTATSPGGGSTNEFRFGDGKGGEEMFFNASKDMAVEVKNNVTESVGANATHSVGSNHTQTVTNSLTATVGGSQALSVGGDQSVAVETRAQDEVGGDHGLDIGGNRDLSVGGDHKRDVGGAARVSVGGMMVDLIVGSATEKTLGSYTHDVGAAIVDITAANRLITVGGNITESSGAAKIIAVRGGRGMAISGAFTQQVAGAIANLASGDKVETAAASYTEVAAGAQMAKANNITIEADGMLSIVMGASMINLNPAMVTIMGVSIKLDGDTSDLGALVIDN